MVSSQPEVKIGNVHDYNFDFQLYTGHGNKVSYETRGQQKFDRTAVYAKTEGHDTNSRVNSWTTGAYSEFGNYTNQSGGHYYDLAYKRELFMTNYIRENGRKFAAIRGEATITNRVFGLWSPDSVR